MKIKIIKTLKSQRLFTYVRIIHSKLVKT